MFGLPAPSDVMESYLLGVLTDPPRHEVSFMFRVPTAKHEFSLRARGVENLLIGEFLEQNIVHEVRIFGRDSDPQDVAGARLAAERLDVARGLRWATTY